MKIIDGEDGAWYLLQGGDSLFLDVNCNLSFIGYTFLLKLNSDERSEYQARGRTYLDELAQRIDGSAPAARDSTSEFNGRDCTKEYRDQVNAAFSPQ